MKNAFLPVLMLITGSSFAQTGCTDPQASNYDPAAIVNDGSCIYNATNYTLVIKDTFAPVLSEISGMAYWNGKIYAHNDSGNPPVLFETDTVNGVVTKEIFLQGVVNTDWEDMTQDATHFYIADVGNNAGNRTDLRVIKFPKSAIGVNYYDTIMPNQIETISFSYPDQVNFAVNVNMTPFDCEAVAYKNNQLHLFTKNWTPGPCVHYTVPSVAGNYTATRMDSLNTGGTLITAADFAANKQLMMLGYKNSGTAEASLWYVYDFDQTDSFFVKGNKRKIGVGDAIVVGQIEAVCFADSTHGFAGNERFNPIAPIDISQKLYRFGTSDWYPYQVNTYTADHDADSLKLLTSATADKIDIYFNLQSDDQVNITLFSAKGKKLRQKLFLLKSGRQHLQLDNPDLSPGIYYILFQNRKGEKKISKLFFQNR